MRAELVLLGSHIDMAPRARRRSLVVTIYLVFTVLLLAVWLTDSWNLGVYAVWVEILACRFFLGGYAYGGLVKSFINKPPRRSEAPPPYMLLKLNMYRPEPTMESTYLNDERELHQRDYAHYRAYQILMLGMLIPVFAGPLHDYLTRTHRMPPVPITIEHFYYGVSLIGFLLFMTLPQVILLWTEPDMEPAPEFVEEC
jgi:hypothetical protein